MLKYFLMDSRLPFIHPSYALEQKLAEDNQRLEFLGDALLGFVMGDYLYGHYPLANEGALTKLRANLVRREALAGLARKLKLEEKILLGQGEQRSGGAQKDSILADAFEAYLSWYYLEHGLRKARKFILECYREELLALRDRPLEMDDPKSRLQEYCQMRQGTVPEYRVTDVIGPEHDRMFLVEVWLGERRLGEGRGRSKKTAQQAAAQNAWDQIKSPPFPEGSED